MRKPAHAYICENIGADQLCSNREADQRLCVWYIETRINVVTEPGIHLELSSCRQKEAKVAISYLHRYMYMYYPSTC